MPNIKESLGLGALGFLALFFLRPEWLPGFVYGFLLVFLVRLGYSRLSQSLAKGRAGVFALFALSKQLLLAGLAILGILSGLPPIGVALGLALWPVSLWIWAARHVREGR